MGAGALIGAGALVLKSDVFGGGGCTEEAFRKRVVDAARSQVGKRELAAYFADAAPQYSAVDPPEWCGIFALWCLHQAGLAKNKTWKTGLGFLETNPPLPKTMQPKPGDIAYFTKFQHQAVIVGVDGDQLEDVNGNGAGGVVSVSHPKVSDAFAIYSIAGLIADAQKGC